MQCVVETSHQDLLTALRSLDVGQLLTLLHDEASITDFLEGVLVFHEIVQATQIPGVSLETASQCVYALGMHGADINQQDLEGNIALLSYLQECRCVEDSLLQAFLRCGSDPTIKNHKGEDVLGYILQANHLPKTVKAKLLDFMPGIWRAVDSDDAMTVRRLINQWCNIRVVRHGMSVIDLAFSKGTENIIRVISGIGSSMDLGHAVWAGDVRCVQRLLEGNKKLNVNLKNMGDGGATPLFYAMCNNDWPMVDLLLKHGARLDMGMYGDKGTELPLYFAALSYSPGIDKDLLHHTIPTIPVSVDQLTYKGRNIIFYCIHHDVDCQLFESILLKCSANVLTQQIETNQDARSYACNAEKMEHVAIIDKVVRDWMVDEENTNNRNILALHGYILPRPITQAAWDNSTHDPVVEFLKLLPEYEEHKTRLLEAVDEGSLVSVKELLYCESWSNRGLIPYFADSRSVGSAQPLLHKAVLRQDLDLVQELGQCLLYRCHLKLDMIRDQYYRTALHYAYALNDGKHLIHVLEDLGMSEHVMDKDGRSPLAFKDRKGLPEMSALLHYHLIQDYTCPEPDPWSVALPLPIMGFISKCAHLHHAKKQEDSKASSNHSNHAQLPSNQQPVGQEENMLPVDNGWDDLSGRFSRLNLESEYLGENKMYDPHFQKNTSVYPPNSKNKGQNEKNDSLYDYNQYRDSNLDMSENINSYQQFSHVPDSNELIAARTQALQNMLYQSADDTGSDLEERNQSGTGDSDSQSDVSDNEEDYEGDYSDLESEGEGDASREAGYCVLL